MMIRLSLPIALTLAGLLVSGCSGGYYVDAAHYRQARVASADDPPRRVASRWRTRTARAGATTENDATAGAARRGAATDLGPVPKRGTPEWERAEAREREQEKRVNDAIKSICRGC